MSALAILCQSKVNGEVINTGEKQAKLSTTSRKDGLPRIEIEFEPRIPVRSGSNETEPQLWMVCQLPCVYTCGTRRFLPQIALPWRSVAYVPEYLAVARLEVH
jgi:hypothetical protein